jgi:hypothetical protein
MLSLAAETFSSLGDERMIRKIFQSHIYSRIFPNICERVCCERSMQKDKLKVNPIDIEIATSRQRELNRQPYTGGEILA